MEPQILEVLGVQIEIRAWRGSDCLFEASLTEDLAGTPTDLTNSEVTMTVVNRAGGEEMFSETKGVGQHVDPSGGVTRFLVPAAVYAELTGQRAFTWKYQISRLDLTTGKSNIYFYGDFRVLAPAALIPVP